MRRAERRRQDPLQDDKSMADAKANLDKAKADYKATE
jgi:hypothetical protein